ncbi:MAG: hypothetical protein ACLQVD_16045 [Capsulimonadaceae bacterium]
MEGHSFLDGSELQHWIEHEIAHLAAHEQDEVAVTEIPDRNLSLRMPIAVHLMVYRIAEKLGRSKTAVAEEILTHAVRDVYRKFDLPRVSTPDLLDYASQTEKAIVERPRIGHGSKRRQTHDSGGNS